MKNDKKILIQGEEWTIKYKTMQEDPNLQNCNGYTDHTIRTIIVEDLQEEQDSLKDLVSYTKRVTRHELIHAFLDESGLRQCSDWARNEEMVDFFATQYPKLMKIFNELEVAD